MSKKTVQTIDDIARLAKVSKSTVSRALNDSPLVKVETHDQIRAIASSTITASTPRPAASATKRAARSLS